MYSLLDYHSLEMLLIAGTFASARVHDFRHTARLQPVSFPLLSHPLLLSTRTFLCEHPITLYLDSLLLCIR